MEESTEIFDTRNSKDFFKEPFLAENLSDAQEDFLKKVLDASHNLRIE